MKTNIILVDADGVQEKREVSLRYVLNYVSQKIKDGDEMIVKTDSGELRFGKLNIGLFDTNLALKQSGID